MDVLPGIVGTGRERLVDDQHQVSGYTEKFSESGPILDHVMERLPDQHGIK